VEEAGKPSAGQGIGIIERVVNFKAVFFDAGETLVHPHPSFPELLAIVLREEGVPVDPALIRENLPVVADRFSQAADKGELWSTSPERSRAWWSSIYRTLLAEMGLPFGDGLATRLYKTFTDLSNYRLFPDVEPTLARLEDAGLRMGLVSNFEEWLERLLESLGVTRYFDVRVISGIEGMEKPDHRIFELALERAAVSPDDAVFVGDNPFFDSDPAGAIGMFAVLLDRRGRFPDHPGTRITSLEELPEAIGVGH
jgi:putative hydrolase of the HAD superfamily